METNWVKSQLLPEILLPTTPLLLRDMTSRKKNKKTHQRSVNTGDGDYWLVIADLIVSLSQKGKKKKKKQPGGNHIGIITTLADIQPAIFGDQFLQSIMYLFYSPSEMQSRWSRGARRGLWSAKESGAGDGRLTAQVSPRWGTLTSSEQERNWANWK